MEIVSYATAKKLKEKGFSCELPFAMYNEIARLHLLSTAAPYNVCDSGYKYREYYDYEDFDEYDYIAPTISQVLKWLREEKKIAINIEYVPCVWQYEIFDMSLKDRFNPYGRILFSDYEEAALAGIEYTLDNLI